MSPLPDTSARRLAGDYIVAGSARSLAGVSAPICTPTHATESVAPTAQEPSEFERGYADGLRAARVEVEAEAVRAREQWQSEARAELDHALEANEQARQHYIATVSMLAQTLAEDRRWAEALAVELAFAAVVRLLGEKHGDHALIDPLCAQARRDVGEGAWRMRVASVDAADVGVASQGLELIPDDTLSPGTCVLETSRGRFDAGLTVRLEHLQQAFLQALSAPRETGESHASHA